MFRSGDEAAVGARERDASMARTTYYECDMSIADVLDPHFIHAYVKREDEERRKMVDATTTTTTTFAATTTGVSRMTSGASTTAVSIDGDDVWCVTTKGRFVGSFTRDTAEVLGLQTTIDGLGKRRASVNLRRERFKVANRFHDRIGECARTLERMKGKNVVRCALIVDGEYAEIQFPPGVDARTVKRRENVATTRDWFIRADDENEALLRSIEPPSREEKKIIDVDDLERVLEWCGRMSLGFTSGDGDLGNNCRRIESRRWKGFILHPELSRVVEHAREVVNGGGAPWAVVTVWAYHDVPSNLGGAPVAKVEREPCRPRGSDAFVIVIFPRDRYVTFSA